jgi:hypothetical protein
VRSPISSSTVLKLVRPLALFQRFRVIADLCFRRSPSQIDTSSEMNESKERPTEQTLDLLYELTRDAPSAQLQASDAVDGKIVQTFAAAGVLIGLAAVHENRSDVATAFVALAVLAFFAVAAVGICSLRGRQYRVTVGADQLWTRYRSDVPFTIKEAFVRDVARGYPENEKNIKLKHKALRIMLGALLVEAGAIGATLIVAAVQS